MHIVTANTLKLPLLDASIRGITSSNLINCPPQFYGNASSIKEQGKLLLREWYRVLEPGGFLVVTSFGYWTPKNRMHTGVYNNNIRKESFLTLKELEGYLETQGFENIAELPIRDGGNRDEHREYAIAEEVGGFLARKPRS